MMIITFKEIIDLIIMTAVLGFIFMGLFRIPSRKRHYEPLKQKKFDLDSFKLACLVTAPAVVLHELAHKFVAMAYGLYTMFHAWLFGLGIGVVLRLIHSPFIIIAPGFVEICKGPLCPASSLPIPPLQLATIAFAGPAINLILWIGSWIILKKAKKLTIKQKIVLVLTKRINMILFIFNMLPFGPLDGAKVFRGLWQAFAG